MGRRARVERARRGGEPPRRRRHDALGKEAMSAVFQFTPPRRRRHWRIPSLKSTEEVSIHASAQEATTILELPPFGPDSPT